MIEIAHRDDLLSDRVGRDTALYEGDERVDQRFREGLRGQSRGAPRWATGSGWSGDPWVHTTPRDGTQPGGEPTPTLVPSRPVRCGRVSGGWRSGVCTWRWTASW